MIGAIELGGTKIKCAVGSDYRNIIQVTRIETSTPYQNMLDIVEFFRACEQQHGAVNSFGVATFGPVDVEPTSEQYGTILKTPKPDWSGFPLRDRLVTEFGVPIAITTDVNAALMSEVKMGAAVGIQDAVYVTIGTGVGAGILVNGGLVVGFLHPEIGHMRIPDGGIAGNCSFHGNCLEGLVSGPAIAKRAGMPAHLIDEEHPVWAEVALNIADMCVNLITILAPKKIILGGGVMNKKGLLKNISEMTAIRLADYLPIGVRPGSFQQLLVTPALREDSGLLGAFILAENSNG